MPPNTNAPAVRMPLLDPHMFWAAGHGIMLFNAAYVILQGALFRGTPPFFYKLGYLGVLLAYGIVIAKSLGKPRMDAQWLQRAYVDENVQYGVLAFYWLISRSINVTMIPFATFSLFHCLTFLRTNILTKFIPRPAAAPAGQARPPPSGLENVSRQIQAWVKANYDGAMRFVAFAELAILARVTVGAITRTSSIVAPLFLVHFIRLRYHASPFTRQAINTAGARIDALAGNQGGVIANVWQTIKRFLSSWGGRRLLSNQPGAPGTAGPGAGAAAAGAQQQRRNQ